MAAYSFNIGLHRVMAAAQALTVCDVECSTIILQLDDMVREQPLLSTPTFGPLTTSTGTSNYSVAPRPMRTRRVDRNCPLLCRLRGQRVDGSDLHSDIGNANRHGKRPASLRHFRWNETEI